MNISRIGPALLAVVCLVPTAVAAPAPDRTPASRGPIEEVLRQRDKLPTSAPPVMVHAVMVGEGIVGLQRHAFVPVTERRTRMVVVPVMRVVVENVRLAGGKVQQVERAVMDQVTQMQEIQVTVWKPLGKIQTTRVPAKSCKFFEVSKEGQLEPLDAAKAEARLKKRTAVLTGGSAKVDPRQLVLIKPGTLYLVVPQATPAPVVPVPRRRGE